MRRSFVLFLPLLGLLAASLAVGEDRGAEKPRRAEKAQPIRPVALDVDAFLKDYDRNGDGYLSKDELPERYRHAFDKLDANKDGKLSRDELVRGAASLQPRRRPSDLVFVLVETSDCDECCAEELQVIYDFLRKIDRDGDGKISADELKGAREGLIRKRVDSVFKELDRNGDGKISRDEARGQVKQHFAELDADKDGFISREELTKAVRERPAALPAGKVPAKNKPVGRSPER